MRVQFLLPRDQMIEFKWKRRKPRANTMNQLRNLASQHRVALLTEWEAIHNE